MVLGVRNLSVPRFLLDLAAGGDYRTSSASRSFRLRSSIGMLALLGKKYGFATTMLRWWIFRFAKSEFRKPSRVAAKRNSCRIALGNPDAISFIRARRASSGINLREVMNQLRAHFSSVLV